MFRTRVITAAWLAPLALGMVFGLSANGFALVLGLLLLAGAWEFRRLAGLTESLAGPALVACQALILVALFLARVRWMPAAPWALAGIFAAWLLMFLRLPAFRPDRGPDRRFRIFSFISALVALSGAWLALVWLHRQHQGPWWILCLFLIIWSADTAAYFTGRAIGRRKLAPALSPGKTVAGMVAGLATGAAVGWAGVRWLPTGATGGAAAWAVLGLLVALIAAGGDLFISLHKRVTGTKDSGHIFPGHGGILDRLDSLLAGAPVFALGLAIAGKW